MRAMTLTERIAFTACLAGSLLAGPASAARLSGIAPVAEHKVYGRVQSLHGSTLVIRTRAGHLLTVDGRIAHTSVLLTLNRPVIVYGTVDTGGVMHATAVWRTFPDTAHWPADH